MTRPDLTQISKWWAGVVVALILILCGVVGYLTISTHQIVQGHDQELTQTRNLVRNVYALQHEATGNHATTLRYLEAICAATPGCPETVQKLAGQ